MHIPSFAWWSNRLAVSYDNCSFYRIIMLMVREISMNILVLNINANSGKTTIAKNLLLPRLPVHYIAVENICDNADIHRTDDRITPQDYANLQEKLLAEQNLLVDVGSSNIEQFFHHLKQNAGDINDFNYFIVPVTADKKSAMETQSTLAILLEFGAKKDRIRLILNKSEVNDNALLLHEFGDIIQMADTFGIARPTVTLKDDYIYTSLRANHLELSQVLNANFSKQDLDNEKLPNLQAFKQVALAANKDLDKVFADLKLDA